MSKALLDITQRMVSLGNFEGEREVVPAPVGRERGVVEGVGQEVVQQRAEREPVRPARREVLQLHILHTTLHFVPLRSCTDLRTQIYTECVIYTVGTLQFVQLVQPSA